MEDLPQFDSVMIETTDIKNDDEASKNSEQTEHSIEVLLEASEEKLKDNLMDQSSEAKICFKFLSKAQQEFEYDKENFLKGCKW